MRLCTFDTDRVGAIAEPGLFDLTMRGGWMSVREIIEKGEIEKAASLAKGKPDKALDEVALCLPLPDPERIFCVGVNYANRNAEYRDDSEEPAYPSLFMRGVRSFSHPHESVLIPKASERLDYEGEIVLVIGKAGRRIEPTETKKHIAGLTIMNEGSVRDWIRHGKFNVTQGKNFDRSGSFGPWIETDLSGLDLENLAIKTRVNGEIRQKDTTASMVFPFSRLIEYISTFTKLLPGDMIATGTPAGAGARFDPPKWLKPGDLVEVEVEGVGILPNRIEKETD